MMDSGQIRAYYRASLLGLRHVEKRQPTGRRFGPEADARWSSFRGDLTTADRIDLLLRDADAQWPAAFGARTVFAMQAVSEDEAFGAEWEPLEPVDAEQLWRDAQASEAPATLGATLQQAASIWDLSLTAFDAGSILAADRLVVAGPSAIAAALTAFAVGTDLDWADQVLVVATPPAHRQLALLGGALLNVSRACRVLPATSASATQPARLLLSDDASSEDAAKARELSAA